MRRELLLTGIFLCVLSGCTEDHAAGPTDLSGSWVEVNTLTDTLAFGTSGGEQYMVLGRGKEDKNGFILPKYGSGPYAYKLLDGDKISLRWMLSANAGFQEYYFRQSGHQLITGKFFDSGTSGERLVFLKLK